MRTSKTTAQKFHTAARSQHRRSRSHRYRVGGPTHFCDSKRHRFTGEGVGGGDVDAYDAVAEAFK